MRHCCALRRPARVLAVVVLALVVGCGDDGPPIDPPDGPGIVELPWWTPEPGEAKNWDIQLRAPFDLSAARAMYDLDLFAVVPSATTLTYADSSTVTVPAGAQPTAIADLHATGTIVVCRVGAGAIRLDDPDAMKFPGFEATPPNDPTAPAAGSVIGWDTLDPNEANANERYIDITNSEVLPLIRKRFELAKMIGCDAIDADKTLMIPPLKPGFTISSTDAKTYHLQLAGIAHESTLELAMGLRNGIDLGTDDDIVAAYDFQISEGLAASGLCCDELRTFINAQKAAFVVDYMDEVSVDSACTQYDQAGVQDGIVKDRALSGTFRGDCL